ncbi:hypothetical protein REPUB_Repub19eG0036700 [Reevesia pubescens]
MENIYKILVPWLASSKVQDYTYQLQAMGRAAFLCPSHDPESRPPMSKDLRMLEGGDMSIPLSLDLNSIGNRSSHFMWIENSKHYLNLGDAALEGFRIELIRQTRKH